MKRSFNITSTLNTQHHLLMEAGYKANAVNSNYASHLPDVYSGAPNRVMRYNQYEQMDLDSHVTSSLDIIAEFCTQVDGVSGLPFKPKFNENPSDSETTIIDKMLKAWVSTNDFDSRLFDIVRNILKYGDQFFIRDPETYKLLWIYHGNVESVMVNESKGKKPEIYTIKDLDLNLQTLSVSQVPNVQAGSLPSIPAATFNNISANTRSGSSMGTNTRFGNSNMSASHVNAAHVVHLNLNNGTDTNWPFGTSILEKVFKSYKQKELLEDSIMIYRIQRAPQRRIFYMDVGDMPEHKAMQFIEQVKNSVNQRRIPSKNGNGQNSIDASYNPLCLSLDTRIPLLDNRTLSLQELIEEYKDGKENWVYSCDPITGKIVPGNITWAGITQESAKVLKLTLDNGQTITCTPNHKFPILGKGFVEAQEISQTDSLISYEIKKEPVNKNSKQTYTQIYDHETNEWKFVHRIVGLFFKNINKHQQFTFLDKHKDSNKTIVHHKDYNRYNNDPRNLQWMNKDDHFSWRAHTKKEWWNSLTEEETLNFSKNISEKVTLRFANFTSEEKEEYSKWCTERSLKVHADMKKHDPERHTRWFEKVGKARSNFINNNPLIENCLPARPVNQEFKVTRKMLEIIEYYVKNTNCNLDELSEILKKDAAFLEEIAINNKKEDDKLCKINILSVDNQRIKCILREFEFDTWKSYVSKIRGRWIKEGEKTIWSQQHLSILVDCASLFKSQTKIIEHLTINTTFLSLLKQLNASSSRINFNKVTRDQIASLLKNFGYKNWNDFVKKIPVYNHKVIKIEFIDTPMTVGTITVDGNERWHAHHTFALEAGIFTKNSVLDDFYIPQRSDGRGSKIETLPGGETAWGIEELQYFDNKLSRGLRVPSSYLPTGPDDSGNTYNDGKVGTALIQEFRFAEYCKRIQRSICSVLDREFKLFLKKRDCNIDSSLFNLNFIEPQSFVTWRQIEIDTTRINNFNQIKDTPYFSKRWAMERFLGLNNDEINKNHDMLMEENPTKFSSVKKLQDVIVNDTPVDLRDVGFNKNDFNQDDDFVDTSEDLSIEPEEPLGQVGVDDTDQETPPSL